MNDAGAGGSGSPAHQVRYGYDIFCDGQNVQRKGGNEGEVWEAFSRCLHMRVCRPDKDRNRNKGRPPDSGEQGDRINALLDPRSKEEYEETVDLAAREIFRMICLVDKRKFLQAATCQPILDKDVIEILKVELKAVRNEVKVEMKRDYQQRQHQHQLQQQEQARRDEERSRRDREEFEREKQEKRRRQNQHRRKRPNGTSTGGGGAGRRCPNPVSPSPAYGLGGDHPAWATGPRRQGSDRRSPFHRSDDHDAFAAAAAYDSDHDAGGRTAGASGPLKPDKLSQARQHIAKMQRKRKGAEPEEQPRGDNTQPNRGRSNNGRAGGGASFQGHIPRKRSAARNGDWSKANTSRSEEVQSKKKQKVGEKHRFKKLVSATEAASPPSKRKPIWEPPSQRTTALATSSLPTPEREAAKAKAKAMSSPRDQSMGHETLGGSQQGPSPSLMKPPSSPVAPLGMTGAPGLAPPEDTTGGDDAGDDAGGGFDMDDSDSPSSTNATLEHASTQSASKTSPRGDVEFTSVSSPFSKERGLKVSRKKAASTASPESPSPNLSDNAIERTVEGCTEQKGAEEAVVKVPLESIVGLDGIVTIEPIGRDDYEKIDDRVVKERSSLCSKTFPPCA